MSDIVESIKKVVHNVGDAISEVTHKGHAEAEHAARDAAGNAMTPGEKVGSMATEVKENVLADVDHTKRDVRNTL